MINSAFTSANLQQLLTDEVVQNLIASVIVRAYFAQGHNSGKRTNSNLANTRLKCMIKH